MRPKPACDGSVRRLTIPDVPIYEFRCARCDARFEALVSVGTETQDCTECGAEGANRVMSLPAQPPKLVKSASGNRRQEAKNRKLNQAAKRDFKRKRQAAKARGGESS
jgi:putative FmdB family regulatory protein